MTADSRTDLPGLELGTLPIEGVGLGHGNDLSRPLPTSTERSQHITWVVGPPGRCPPRNQDLHHRTLTDISPSLGGRGAIGNDPAGLRHAAALKAIEKVGAHCRCNREFFQLLTFDMASGLDVGPVRLDSKGVQRVREAVATEDVGWGISTLGPSLATACQSLERVSGKSTLTVMSDFLLTDLDEVIPALIDFPADSIHVIALTAPAPPPLEAASNIRVTAAGWNDRPGIVAEAIYSELVRFRQHSRTQPRRGIRRRRTQQ